MGSCFGKVIFISAALFSGATPAATFTVDNIDDLPDFAIDGKCSSVFNPSPDAHVCTLRAAIMEANATPGPTADTIELQAGATYLLSIAGRDEDFAKTGDLDILAPLQIIGNGAVVDAGSLDRAFHVFKLATFMNLTIANGDPTASMGKEGGGIRTETTKVQLEEVRLRDNQAGGIALAACQNVVGSSTIWQSEISGNTGGGLLALGCSITMKQSAVYGNHFGALYITGASRNLILENSIVSGNHDNPGAAIYAYDGANVSILYSTVVDNSGSGQANVGGGTFAIEKSVFTHNADGNCSSAGSFKPTLSRDNVFGDFGCSTGDPDDNSIFNVKTTFIGPLGYYGGPTPTHRPLTVSTVLDRIPSGAAHCQAGVDPDQRDTLRPIAFRTPTPACDVGAVELESEEIFFDSLEWF